MPFLCLVGISRNRDGDSKASKENLFALDFFSQTWLDKNKNTSTQTLQHDLGLFF